MRFISTRTHGVLDYAIGVLLILSPWLLGFATDQIDTWLPVLVGAGIILYSLFTDYEAGLIRAIDMRTHLAIEAMVGLLLAVSPWVFDFALHVFVPHLLYGLVLIGMALTTHPAPSYGYPGARAL